MIMLVMQDSTSIVVNASTIFLLRKLYVLD